MKRGSRALPPAVRGMRRHAAVAVLIAAAVVLAGWALWRGFMAQPPAEKSPVSSGSGSSDGALTAAVSERGATGPAAAPAAGLGLGAGATAALPFGPAVSADPPAAAMSEPVPPSTGAQAPLPAEVATLRAGSPGWRAPIFELIEQRRAAEARKAEDKKRPETPR